MIFSNGIDRWSNRLTGLRNRPVRSHNFDQNIMKLRCPSMEGIHDYHYKKKIDFFSNCTKFGKISRYIKVFIFKGFKKIAFWRSEEVFIFWGFKKYCILKVDSRLVDSLIIVHTYCVPQLEYAHFMIICDPFWGKGNLMPKSDS